MVQISVLSQERRVPRIRVAKSHNQRVRPLLQLTCIHGETRWSKWLEREFTDRKVRGSNPLPLDFSCLVLGNLAVSQPSCNLRVAWQLGTERVLQLNDYIHGPLASATFGSDAINDVS
ncbi:hypothetical protein CSKR_110620 [Clonorchis sinensis]|uniref:Uncharacterized protein n=1 Tax=Clonorchis sinensis TaxID=79923 RepID=A0A3R7CRZ6_CLOSI|nr:hypothetical protein CSKR_110620 [Clonorchis sinensis]